MGKSTKKYVFHHVISSCYASSFSPRGRGERGDQHTNQADGQAEQVVVFFQERHY